MLTIHSDAALVDAPLTIHISKLDPHAKTTLSVSTQDGMGRDWRASALFEADENGVIEVAKQAPLSGSYSGVDPMGLIWSMCPLQGELPASMFFPEGNKPLSLHFKVISGGKVQAEKIIDRQFLALDVEQEDVEQDGVAGRCYFPKGAGPFPAVMLCAGSSGGIRDQVGTAALLASHGFATFILAYFNYANLPKTLYEIPLETFRVGVQWLQKHPKVIANRIALLGASKGAEGVLAATAFLPDIPIRALVAISPSAVVWQGIGRGKPEERPSWSLDGKPLPYLKLNAAKILPQFMLAKLIRRLRLGKLFPALVRTKLLPAYADVKKATTAVKNATIPVEKIKAPLLLISGAEDRLWPSTWMSQQIIKRRRENHHNEDQHLNYAHAGHTIRFPYQPVTIPWVSFPNSPMTLEMGGRPRANAEAFADSWQKTLHFLREHLYESY